MSFTPRGMLAPTANRTRSHNMLPRLLVLFSLFFSWLPLLHPSPGKAGEWIDPDGIRGSLVIVGGGKIPDMVRETFWRLANGEEGRLVIIPAASTRADREPAETLLAPWQEHRLASVELLHARDRGQASDPAFLEPLRKATGVWISGGSQTRLVEAYTGTGVEKELHALLERGGVVGGTSAAAAVLSRLAILSGNAEAKTGTGFELLPGAVIDHHFSQRKGGQCLRDVIQKHPGVFGVGIDEETALIVRGRSMRVLGEHHVTLLLPGTQTREPRREVLQARQRADLTTWRRAARARAGPPFPPARPAIPEVPRGALVIVGGGVMPRAVTRKFIDLAGGPDALIVVLPTALPDPIRSTGASFLQRAGARNVRVLKARKKEDVESEKSLALLHQARGIWFGWGRQWRFVDAYEGTKAHDLFHAVLRRGGVIGGSSAGASILAEYLCRSNPLNNREIICEGYEQGLGFLPGTGIDQHFSQRHRLADMTLFKNTYPQLLGIGIDEATALIVQGHVGTVMGRGKVYFYDRDKPSEKGTVDHVTVEAGRQYDLKERKPLSAKESAEPQQANER
jgi:cyanophycinase